MPIFIIFYIFFFIEILFRYIFEFIGYITGYDASVQKCYGFNVSSEVDNINSNLTKIESSFKTEFGRLDFSQIKIYSANE